MAGEILAVAPGVLLVRAKCGGTALHEAAGMSDKHTLGLPPFMTRA